MYAHVEDGDEVDGQEGGGRERRRERRRKGGGRREEGWGKESEIGYSHRTRIWKYPRESAVDSRPGIVHGKEAILQSLSYDLSIHPNLCHVTVSEYTWIR